MISPSPLVPRPSPLGDPLAVYALASHPVLLGDPPHHCSRLGEPPPPRECSLCAAPIRAANRLGLCSACAWIWRSMNARRARHGGAPISAASYVAMVLDRDPDPDPPLCRSCHTRPASGLSLTLCFHCRAIEIARLTRELLSASARNRGATVRERVLGGSHA